jgi:hypothetical protein
MLSKLDEQQLRKIMKTNGFSIPKTFAKRDLVKYLSGTLTLEKIKEYSAEVYERETKREIIRETIKEKGIRIKEKETTKLQVDKIHLIYDLAHSHEKIDDGVLGELARSMHEPIPSGKGANRFDKMSENLLERLHAIFVKNESDGKGLFLEFRTANFIMRQSKCRDKISRVSVRYTTDIGQIDVVGFNSEDVPLIIAECKDRSVKREDLAKWLENSRQMFEKSKGDLAESYFVTSSRLTDESILFLENNHTINSKNGQLKVATGITGYTKNLFMANKGFFETGNVSLSIYEVRQGQFTKVFPKK